MFDKVTFVSCLYKNDMFYCDWYNKNGAINTDQDYIYLKLLAEGDMIKWKNPNEYEIILKHS